MPFSAKKRTVLVVFAVVAALLAGGSLVPNFLKPANLLNVIRQCSIIVICAVGIAPVIITRGIDLSVGGNVTFCGMMTGFLLLRGVPVALAIAAALVAGIIIGLISGALNAYLEVPAFIATLVIGQITQGSAFLLNNGRSFGGFPGSYVFLGNGSLLGIPVSNYIMVLFVVMGVILTTKLPIGTRIYGLGGNGQVLKNAGVNTAKIKVFVFALSGFCASAAGVLLAAQLDTAHPTQGEPYQLDAIAACIIGGVSMSGGEGKIILVMVGALIIGSIRNILNLLAVHSFFQNILVGVIIIAVVAVSMLTRVRRTYRTAQFARVKS
jgi:ribose transport system permease protein